MPLSGAAIGPDAVMVWTGERELTRFDRGGARTSFTVPMPPLAAHIGRDGLRLVDTRGTVHRYSLTGRHEGATSIPFKSSITTAALAADCPRMAVIYGDEAMVVENGEPVAWKFERPVDGYEEIDVDLSHDGQWLLVRHTTSTFFPGHHGDGVRVIDREGNPRIDHYDHLRDIEDLALSPGGDYIAWIIRSGDRRWVCFEDDQRESGLMCHGRTARFTFGDDMLGAVYTDPALLEVMQLSTRRRAQLELPESFDELIFSGDDAVVVHPELGAWWIPLASLSFEEPA